MEICYSGNIGRLSPFPDNGLPHHSPKGVERNRKTAVQMRTQAKRKQLPRKVLSNNRMGKEGGGVDESVL